MSADFQVRSRGIRRRSAICRTRPVSCAARAPLPMKRTGRSAVLSNSTAAETWAGRSGFCLRGVGSEGRSVVSSIIWAWTSRGRSSQTGPRRPVVARWIARSISNRMSLGSRMVFAYFVSGVTTETMSSSCGPMERTPRVVSRSARLTWPERKMQGVESSHAAASPVMVLVPPGPVVTSAAASLPVNSAWAWAAKATACSCRQQT